MTDLSRFASIMAQLDALFGGRPAVTPGQALGALPGPTPADPDSAAGQRIDRGTFPFPFRLIAGRRVVAVVDVAAVLVGGGPELPVQDQPPARRGPGRPKKAAGVPGRSKTHAERLFQPAMRPGSGPKS